MGLGAPGRCSPGSRGTEWSGARTTLRAGALLTAWGTSRHGAASPSFTRTERGKRLRARWCRGTASGCWWRLPEGRARPGGIPGGTQFGAGQRGVTEPQGHSVVGDLRDHPVPPLAVPAAPWLNAPSLPRREFPLHAHHHVSFHGNKSKNVFFFFADNVWGLSGHVLAVDKESEAQIGTKAAYFTPRLGAFVTHLGVVRSHGAQPQPAIPFLQETSLSGLRPLASFYRAVNCWEMHSGEPGPQGKPNDS